uniref:Cytoplasmic tRNA 2-thiolation protein 2 n=1 Tax=Strongyloides papillosus TaxID=174720 RepID=A0A0N5BFD5_STREA
MSSEVSIPIKKCVKCPELGPFFGFDSKRATYCKEHFIIMVKQKFFFALGKNRVFKDGKNRNPLLIFKGDINSSFLVGIIVEGKSKNPYKKIDIDPTIIAVTDEENLEEVQNFYIKTKDSFKDVDWPLHFVHLASIFNDNFNCVESSILGIDKINKLTEFCNLFKTPSAKIEIKRILWDLLYFKLGKYFNSDKVLLPVCADELGRVTCNALCFGRGASIGHLTEVVDNRHDGISLLRPLHDISQKEINSMLEFNLFTGWKIYEHERIDGEKSNTIQNCNSQFLDSLLYAGFPATIPTLLSISGKVRPNAENNILSCKLCHTKCGSRSEIQVMCQACFDFIETEMEANVETREMLEKIIEL